MVYVRVVSQSQSMDIKRITVNNLGFVLESQSHSDVEGNEVLITIRTTTGLSQRKLIFKLILKQLGAISSLQFKEDVSSVNIMALFLRQQHHQHQHKKADETPSGNFVTANEPNL